MSQLTSDFNHLAPKNPITARDDYSTALEKIGKLDLFGRLDLLTDRLEGDQKKTFLLYYSRSGSVKHAQARADVTGPVFQRWQEKDKLFEIIYASIKATLGDILEDVLLNRAINGWRENVWYQGEKVGTEKKMDHKLSLTMLKRFKEEYRESTQAQNQINISGDGGKVMLYMPDNSRGDTMDQLKKIKHDKDEQDDVPDFLQ